MSMGAIYLIIAIPLALLLSAKADHRPLVAVFLLWLLGSPVLEQEAFMLHVPSLNFDLQPIRIMLPILLPALAINRLAPQTVRKRAFAPLTSFEKALLAYVAISILSIVLNYESLDPGQVVKSVEQQLVFVVLYFSARDYLTPGDYRVLERGIVLLAIFSALVAIIQFVYDPQFFRVAGTFRGAFASVARSTGAFGQEYEHSMYVTFAIIVVGLREHARPFWRWICLAILSAASVFLTFQRMPWAVFLFAGLSVLVIRYWNDPLWRGLGTVMIGIVLVIAAWVPWSELLATYLPPEFLRDRLLSDTLTGRLSFNEFGISLLPKYPFGLGATTDSPVYNQEYYDFGLALRVNNIGGYRVPTGIGYTVHNGFLAAAIRFGLVGGLAFGGMLFGCLIFSVRHLVASNCRTSILLLIVAVIILYNLTEDFSSANGRATLLGVWLMGSFAGRSLYDSSRMNRGSIPDHIPRSRARR